MSGYHPPASSPELPDSFKNYVPPVPTAVPGPADIQLALAGWAQRRLAEQSWWQKSANTVTTAIGGAGTLAATIATYYLTAGTDVPQWLTIVIGVLGFAGTLIGVKNTKNGFTYQGAAQVQQAVLDPAVLGTVQRVLAQEPFPDHVSEAAIDQAAEMARKWVAQHTPGYRP